MPFFLSTDLDRQEQESRGLLNNRPRGATSWALLTNAKHSLQELFACWTNLLHLENDKVKLVLGGQVLLGNPYP